MNGIGSTPSHSASVTRPSSFISHSPWLRIGMLPAAFALALSGLAQQVPTLRIDNFTPPGGGMGDVITIIGAGFGNNPDNLCVVIMNGDLALPMEVIAVDNTQIKARLGAVDPGAQPGPIMVALGEGGREIFKPLFPDINVREPVWSWRRSPPFGPAANSQQSFRPVPTPPPVGPGLNQSRWFFSGPPTNGVLCLYLDGNWPNPSKVRVQARAHDHAQGTGHDLDAYHIEFPGGGSLLDCAYRICDTIRCAFMQRDMFFIPNCRVEQVPGANRVKLTLSLPEGHIDWGNLNVCVEPAAPPPAPVITGVQPQQGCESNIVTIAGTGFGQNPNNICAVVMMPDNRSVPLEVLTCTPTLITAQLGPVPTDLLPNLPGHIMVGLGDGNPGTFMPAFQDVVIRMPVWTWVRTGPNTTTTIPFFPLPCAQPLNRCCFFSGPPTTDGKLCVFLDKQWPPHAKVRIEARAHDHQRGIGRDLRAVCVEFGTAGPASPDRLMDPENTLRCALRICDVIVCAFRQQAGIAVECSVERDPLTGLVKITLSLADGRIGWGNLNICFEAIAPPTDPIITSFEPAQGRPGDVITIRGSGFGNNPDNLCAVVMNGGVSIPLQAIKASDHEVQAVLGQVPPNAQPGPIMVGLGQGGFGRFRPAFFDVFVADDVWTWNRTAGMGMSPNFFRPLAAAASPAQWFFSGPPTNGVICLFLSGNWPAPSRITVQARAHDHARGIGRDLAAYDIRLEGGGSLFDCALRICDTIACAFHQQAGLPINCTVTPMSNDVVKITLGLPDGRIDWGNLNVCVEKGPDHPVPVIAGVNPPQGRDGDILTITGKGFGNNPDNLCAVVMSGDESIPLQVLSVSNDVMRAMLGPVSPMAQPGPIMVGRGEGRVGTFQPVLTNIVVRKPVWVWNRNGGPAGMGGTFRPIPNQPTTTNVWFWSGPASNGMVMVTISGNWPSNTLLRIEARLHDHRQNVGHDLRAICIQFPVGGTLQQCAAQICDVIRCAFLQQAGITVNCQAVQLTPTQIKLVLTFAIPNLRVDWGNFNICVQAAPPEPPPIIISVTPLQATAGGLVTIRGTNFPTDPNDVCLVHMGPPGTPGASMSTPFEVLTSTTTQIVARLGPVNPTAQPGPIMVGIGDGQVGTPQFAFFDVFAELPVWTWNRNGPTAMTPPTISFRPIPTPETNPCPRWYFSGPPVNGELCLFLRKDCPWPRPARIRIEARAHDHTKGIGRDLRAISIRFEGGENTLECAYRICDVIRCAFRQQGGFEVNCTVEIFIDTTGNEAIKLTLGLPEGHIDWGNFNVCVDPIVAPDPVITSVSPLLGGEGTLVRVRGTNFPTDPNDVCLVVMSGNESVPIEVLTASPTEVTGVLGAVNPQAGPGKIMIGNGDGTTGFFRPAFFDIFLDEPVWTWERTGGAGMGAQDFTPIPSNPPPTRVWFFSGPPTADGKLCVFLRGNWPPGAKIRIEARAHDHERRIGRDLRAICVRLPNGGSLLECARRICDVIRCAFLQNNGIAVNCTLEAITDAAGNVTSVKLTLSLPEGHISWGNFNVCVEAPPVVAAPVIAEVTPLQGGEGDIITIKGTGFGNNPNNVCAVIMNGNSSLPLEVLTATDTGLTARLGAIPPEAEPGPIMIGLGQGNLGRFRPAFFDVFVADDVWTWNRNGGPMANSPSHFRPIPRPPPPYTRWFFGEQPKAGVLCLYLHGKWPDPAKVRIEARVHDHGTGIGHDLRALCVEWGSFSMNWTGAVHVIPMNLLSCAQRVCDTIACAFSQQAGIAVNCEVLPIDDNTVKLVLSLPSGNVSWGNFNVCVGPVNDDPGPQIEIVKNPLLPGTTPAVTLCWPLHRTGYCLQCVDKLGPVNDWVLPPGVMRGDGPLIKMTLPRPGPHRFYRLYREPPLLTNPD